MSEFQHLKQSLMLLQPFAKDPKDAIHIYLGFACLVVAILVLRSGMSSYRLVLPGILLSLALETLDLWDDIHSLGHFRWAASARDIVNTNLIPFVLVTLSRFTNRAPLVADGLPAVGQSDTWSGLDTRASPPGGIRR